MKNNTNFLPLNLLFSLIVCVNLACKNNNEKVINLHEYEFYLKKELKQNLRQNAIYIFIDIHCSDCLWYYINEISKLHKNNLIKFILIGVNDNEKLNKFIKKLSDKFYVIEDIHRKADLYDLAIEKISVVHISHNKLLKHFEAPYLPIEKVIKYCNSQLNKY